MQILNGNEYSRWCIRIILFCVGEGGGHVLSGVPDTVGVPGLLDRSIFIQRCNFRRVLYTLIRSWTLGLVEVSCWSTITAAARIFREGTVSNISVIGMASILKVDVDREEWILHDAHNNSIVEIMRAY